MSDIYFFPQSIETLTRQQAKLGTSPGMTSLIKSKTQSTISWLSNSWALFSSRSVVWKKQSTSAVWPCLCLTNSSLNCNNLIIWNNYFFLLHIFVAKCFIPLLHLELQEVSWSSSTSRWANLADTRAWRTGSNRDGDGW